jgi:cellulose synthase/poly-beta-1,6-N-acetylglucosamine synthase-like glycosyltransferase
MTRLGILLVLGSTAFAVYTFAIYPGLLLLLGRVRRREPVPTPSSVLEWPHVTITMAVFNEEAQIAGAVESLLRLDYPRDRLQILIVSDGSTDRTADIVRGFEHRGVELLRQAKRAGKTAAENLAASYVTGEIIVNTDASIRIQPGSLKPLIAPFADPTIGLASGRDISVGATSTDTNLGEGGYVGYEMWVRDLETRVEGIVGASGSLYALRRELHRIPLPDSLSRDFASALNTRERGYRPVSVAAATAIVPRTQSLKREYRRKLRTITRGIETLWYKRSMLNPAKSGVYSWMLLSHKVCRWALPWVALLGLLGLGLLASESALAAVIFTVAMGMALVGGTAWLGAGDGRLPVFLSIPAFLIMSNVATAHASLRALHGDRNPIWEPTRRHAP